MKGKHEFVALYRMVLFPMTLSNPNYPNLRICPYTLRRLSYLRITSGRRTTCESGAVRVTWPILNLWVQIISLEWVKVGISDFVCTLMMSTSAHMIFTPEGMCSWSRVLVLGNNWSHLRSGTRPRRIVAMEY